MKQKRAPGGGRKAKAGPTSSLTFRIPDDMRKQLEREAAEKAATVSDRLQWHLRRSFNRQQEEERDPALQGLLVLIAVVGDVLARKNRNAPGCQCECRVDEHLRG